MPIATGIAVLYTLSVKIEGEYYTKRIKRSSNWNNRG